MKRFFLLVALIECMATSAQDRLFTYTYQSTVLNKGQKELEVWNTLRTGKANYFSRLDHRTEFEVGLGNNVQTSFYLNLTSKTGSTALGANNVLNTETELSFSNEWKWKLSDPVANPVGIALYGEYGIASNEYELEGKLILDKRMGHLTLAANAIYEMELKPEYTGDELEFEKEHKAGLNVALAYSLSPRFAVTLENTYNNVFAEGELEHSALYSGIGCSYVQDKFWLNFTVLPQVKSFKGATDGGLNLNEFEKVQCRLLFSYVF